MALQPIINGLITKERIRETKYKFFDLLTMNIIPYSWRYFSKIISEVYGYCQNVARTRRGNREVSIKQQTHSLYQTRKMSNEGGKMVLGKDLFGKSE